MSIYNQKKIKKERKERDPSLPAPPNLLNHEKRMKEITLTISEMQTLIRELKDTSVRQQKTIERFGIKLRQSENQIDHLISMVNSLIK